MNESIYDEKYTMMTSQPITRLIPRLAVPTIISMLITAFYNMADTYFVSGEGTNATAAVGVVFSLMSVIQAIGFMIGMGSGNFVSRLLGAKDRECAERTVSTAFFTAIAAGTILCVVGLLNIKPLVRLLGSIPEVEKYAIDYARYILVAAPFMMGVFVINNQLRAQGYAAFSMIGITTGGILNVILDPIFITAMGMGVAGAALATMISQIVSFIILITIINLKQGAIGIKIKRLIPSRRIYGEILYSGLPSLCRQGLGAVSNIILNFVAGNFSPFVMAAMAVTNKLMMLIYSALIGFAQGFQPVCGFNYGAKKYDRVREAYKFSLKVAVVLLSVLGIVAILFAPHIIGIFKSDDARIIPTGAMALRLHCITLPLQAYIIMSQFMIQSIGNGGRAALISMSRQGLFLVPAYLILPKLIGVTGVISAQPISDLFTFLLSVVVARSVVREISVACDKKN